MGICQAFLSRKLEAVSSGPRPLELSIVAIISSKALSWKRIFPLWLEFFYSRRPR